MPYVRFSTIDDAPKRKLVPDGVYAARIEDIEEKETRGGNALWRVCLRIVGGGRPEGSANGECVFDNWAFSPRALPRLKLIVARFGLDVDSDREITPEDFIGREVDIDVRARRFELDGETREENVVPYGGYRRAMDRRDASPSRREESRPRRDGSASPREANRAMPRDADRPPPRHATRPGPEEEVPF